MYLSRSPFDPDDASRTRFDAVIAGVPFAGELEAAADAVAALDGRLVMQVSPEETVATLDRYVGKIVVVLDVVGLTDGEAFDHAQAIAALCEMRDWPLLVAIGRSQIDTISAAIGGRVLDTHLLCEAAPAEWIAAIAVAANSVVMGDSGVLCDRVRESEAARLARLNEEVARIADVLARLSGRDDERANGSAAAEPRPGFAEAPATTRVTATEVRETIRARRLRDRFFPARMFEDPAWDIILDLFAAQLERAQVSVSSLCIAAAVAPTTALRWITKLTDAGLLEREADPFDKRRAFMALSAPARDGMARYLAALEEAGLRLV